MSRLGDAWWLSYAPGKDGVFDFDELPPDVKPKLALLLLCPDGFRDEKLGRRIAEDIYWIF